MPQEIDVLIRGHWDIPGLLTDLREQPWQPTEPGRTDRMAWIGSYQAIERLARESVIPEDWEEAEQTGFHHEIVDDYLEVLGDILSQDMGQHVYTAIEDGDVFIGQYEEGAPPGEPRGRKDWDPRMAAIELIELGQPRKKKRIPYRRALAVARKVEREVWHNCNPAEMILVGSLRRKRPQIADIEFVLLPMGAMAAEGPERDEEIQKCAECLRGLDYSIGGKLRKATKVVDGVKVELYLAHDRQELGGLVFMYTGDFQFNIAMRRKAKLRGLRLNQYGIWDEEGNPVLQSPDERDFFKFLEVEYHTPEERSVATRTPEEKRRRAATKRRRGAPRPKRKVRKPRPKKRKKQRRKKRTVRMKGLSQDTYGRMEALWEDDEDFDGGEEE